MTPGRFAGKVGLIVGAGTPADADDQAPAVGAAIAVVLARQGARVAVVGEGPDGVGRTADLVRAGGAEALPLTADAADEAACRATIAAVVDEFGRVDYLVNNLGIRLSGKGVVDVGEDEWDRVMAINAKGLVLMTKHAVPVMPRGSAIVNISSIGANRPTFKTSIVYSASKGAVNSLTTTMALQLGPLGIRVNAVSPGNLWTPIAKREVLNRKIDPDLETARERRRGMNPLGMEGNGWHIADAVAFFLSEEAGWITGQILTVDGGGMLAAPASVQPNP